MTAHAPLISQDLRINVYLFWRGGGQGAEREETQNPKQAVRTKPDAGLELSNCEIMTRAKDGHSTDSATQVPQDLQIKKRTLL